MITFFVSKRERLFKASTKDSKVAGFKYSLVVAPELGVSAVPNSETAALFGSFAVIKRVRRICPGVTCCAYNSRSGHQAQ